VLIHMRDGQDGLGYASPQLLAAPISMPHIHMLALAAGNWGTAQFQVSQSGSSMLL